LGDKFTVPLYQSMLAKVAEMQIRGASPEEDDWRKQTVKTYHKLTLVLKMLYLPQSRNVKEKYPFRKT